MAISAFGAIKTVGGTAGALDDIIHTNITDGDPAIVVDAVNDVVYHYTYNSSSAAAESDPDTINPDSNSGNGRWILTKSQSFSSFVRGIIDSDNLSEFLNGLSLEYDEIFIPAPAFSASTTNGAADPETIEYSDVEDVDMRYVAFGGTSDEYVFITLVMPPSWDRGTFKVKYYWAPASGATQGDIVTWGMDGLSIGNDDNIDGAAYGTSVTVDDTVIAGGTGDLHVSAATSAITIAGIPTLGDIISLRVYRDADGSEGSDDMTEDAHLFGISIQYKRSNEVATW